MRPNTTLSNREGKRTPALLMATPEAKVIHHCSATGKQDNSVMLKQIILYSGLAKNPKASKTEEPQPCHDTTDANSKPGINLLSAPSMSQLTQSQADPATSPGAEGNSFCSKRSQMKAAAVFQSSREHCYNGKVQPWEFRGMDGQKWCWVETHSGEM